jgi:hypothetical protein
LLLSWVQKYTSVEHGVHIGSEDVVLLEVRFVDVAVSLEYPKYTEGHVISRSRNLL